MNLLDMVARLMDGEVPLADSGRGGVGSVVHGSWLIPFSSSSPKLPSTTRSLPVNWSR